MTTNSNQPDRLSAAEAHEVTQHLAQFGAAGLPLAGGLRAAAAESTSPRVVAALERMASGIEQGQSLEQMLRHAEAWLPRYVGGLIAAAARTGRLAEALTQLVEQQHAVEELRRELRRGLVYPVVVSMLALAMVLLVLTLVVPTFEATFLEFRLSLPWLTQLLFWWRDIGIWLLAVCVGIALAAAWLFRRFAGPAAWHHVLATMPLFGPLRLWLGLAEWSGLVSVLVRYRVAIPDALRLSADGMSNAFIADLSRSLADRAEQGQRLSEAMTQCPQMPRGLTPLVSWGESTDSLADALSDGREILSRRVQLRTAVVHAAVPPVLFIVIGCIVALVLGAILMPLVSLIQSLS